MFDQSSFQLCMIFLPIRRSFEETYRVYFFTINLFYFAHNEPLAYKFLHVKYVMRMS